MRPGPSGTWETRVRSSLSSRSSATTTRERAAPGLQVALGDPDRDVSWNAAVALAQLGDASGETQLLLMLDRAYLDGLTEIDDARKLLAMQSAIQASGLVASETLDARLRNIASSDPNLAIRKLALEALEGR